MFAIFDGVLSKDKCDQYAKRIEDWYAFRVRTKHNPMYWTSRKLDISDDPICADVKLFLEKKLGLITEMQSADLQCWPIDSFSPLHVHNERGREICDFNSLLYLNDGFDGGEFHTSTGIDIKPRVGRLTFFDGSMTQHGVKPVLNNNRYTIAFWWKNTKFK